ncbi:MAG: hypothetical protein QOH12_3629 [Solirubrobacteraceae bacterium]|jgi:hypothetical protein|nr:hypothetical protein [Solirubrobacteraceae bacterium]
MKQPGIRNLIPPVYALLVIAGFLISATAGVVALIVGGSLSGLLWSATSGRRRRVPDDGETRDERAAARAARRSGRR